MQKEEDGADAEVRRYGGCVAQGVASLRRRNKEVPTAIGRQSPWGFGDAASSRVKCAKCSRRPIAQLTRLEAAYPNISPVAYCPTSTGFACTGTLVSSPLLSAACVVCDMTAMPGMPKA